MTDDGEIRREQFRSLLSLLDGRTLVDLGCGPGVFAEIARAAGWDVTAVDVRTERWSRHADIKWVQADVRGFDLAPYDVVSCLGLFYHLTCVDQVNLLRRCREKPVILDTHFSLTGDAVCNGYRGSLYREKGLLTSSSGNSESFWPLESELVRMLGDCGFRRILKWVPSFRQDRGFYLVR